MYVWVGVVWSVCVVWSGVDEGGGGGADNETAEPGDSADSAYTSPTRMHHLTAPQPAAAAQIKDISAHIAVISSWPIATRVSRGI